MSDSGQHFMRNSRGVLLEFLVRAKDVMRELGCSRSLAYQLLREASGRGPGEVGLMRVLASEWDAFVKRKFGATSNRLNHRRTVAVAALRPPHNTSGEASPVRVTQPRAVKKETP